MYSNEHDLLKLEALTTQLRVKHQASQSHIPVISSGKPAQGGATKPGLTLKRFAMVVRAVVRLRMMAREWKRQEELRKTLASRWDEYQRRDAERVEQAHHVRVEHTHTHTHTQLQHRQRTQQGVEHTSNVVKKQQQQVRFPREQAAAATVPSVDSSVASSVAPLRFDVDLDADRQELGFVPGEELDGTEAFSVDSF